MPADQRPANVEDALDNAATQIMRAGQIIAHLREFISRGEPDKTIQSLHELSRRGQELVIVEAKQADINVVFRLDAADDRILADRVQIKQVIVNLMRNARTRWASRRTRKMIVSTSLGGPDDDPGRCGGHRLGPHRGGAGEPVRALHDHQGQWPRRRPDDRALDRRGPLREDMGRSQQRRRRDLQLHAAARRDGGAKSERADRPCHRRRRRRPRRAALATDDRGASTSSRMDRRSTSSPTSIARPRAASSPMCACRR